MSLRRLAATPQGMVGVGARPWSVSQMCAHHRGVDVAGCYGTRVFNITKAVWPEGAGGRSG